MIRLVEHDVPNAIKVRDSEVGRHAHVDRKDSAVRGLVRFLDSFSALQTVVSTVRESFVKSCGSFRLSGVQ